MRRLGMVMAVVTAMTFGCDDGGGDGDDNNMTADAAPGTPDAAPGTPDAAPGAPDAAPGDVPSTDHLAPVVLVPGQTFTASIGSMEAHFFSFTPAAAGRFTVTLSNAGQGIDVNWCDTSAENGCLCTIQGGFTTCCNTMMGDSCSFTMEKSLGVPLDANVTIFPQVYAVGPAGAYTLTISQPL